MQNNEIHTESSSTSRKTGFFSFIIRGFRSILGGNFLVDIARRKAVVRIILLVLIAIFYIANSYIAEKKARRIEQLQADLKKLGYDFVEIKSMRMRSSSQSAVALRLVNKGILESTVPPEKIIIPKEKRK